MTLDLSITGYCQNLLAFMESPTPSPDTFNTLALSLYQWHLRSNPVYRRFCERRGTRAVPSWAEIPAMPTAAFKEQEVTWLAEANRTVVFHSSGTTQMKPSRHFHNAQTLAIYEASLLPWFKAHLLFEMKEHFGFLVLAPPNAQAPHSSLVHMFKTIERSLPHHEFNCCAHSDADGAWQIDVDRSRAVLTSACARGLPLILLGPAFGYVQLMDGLGNERFQLPPGSRAMETGGYKGRTRTLSKQELRGNISARFGLPLEVIVGEYGMSELSSQAYDHPAGQPSSYFQFPPWARALIVSPETWEQVPEGNLGLIRVVDLANVSSTPAVQTEDLGIRRGTGFEWVGRSQAAEPRGCSLLVTETALPQV